jgi:hypothetical protein
MPFKKVYVKNCDINQSYDLFLINMAYHTKNKIFNYNFKEHETVFIEFKNNKRHILTIIKARNVIDLIRQINKISTNKNGKYDKNKIDNPPFLIIKSIKYVNNNYEFDITKILKNIICYDHPISIDELLFFYGINLYRTYGAKCKIHYYKQFAEYHIEYDFNDIKLNDITFFKNI